MALNFNLAQLPGFVFGRMVFLENMRYQELFHKHYENHLVMVGRLDNHGFQVARKEIHQTVLNYPDTEMIMKKKKNINVNH